MKLRISDFLPDDAPCTLGWIVIVLGILATVAVVLMSLTGWWVK